MVLCIAEYLDALFYWLVNHELASYLIILATFTDAIINRYVAFAVVPFVLSICADCRQKSGNNNDNYVNVLYPQGNLLTYILIYNFVEFLHKQTQFFVINIELYIVHGGDWQNLWRCARNECRIKTGNFR